MIWTGLSGTFTTSNVAGGTTWVPQAHVWQAVPASEESQASESETQSNIASPNASTQKILRAARLNIPRL